MIDENILREIIRLSGSGKKVSPNARHHGIYTSFTVPGLDHIRAVRDTKQRFADFAIPEDLKGKTAIDVGCNVGAVSLELARRGAKVFGVEYREDRVQLCRELFKIYDGFEGEFEQIDLNDPHITSNVIGSRLFDMVWCSSVDEYIHPENLHGFYQLLLELAPQGILYLESNMQGGVSEILTMTRLREAGAKSVEYVGNGHSGGISRKRKLIRASLQP